MTEKKKTSKASFWQLSNDNYETTITLEQYRRYRKANEDANISSEQ